MLAILPLCLALVALIVLGAWLSRSAQQPGLLVLGLALTGLVIELVLTLR